MIAWALLFLGQGSISPPLPAEEAIRAFRIPPGFRIELVASHPQVESPVAMAFGADGRLWVVEMRDYPNGPGAGGKPAGRIRVLTDRDGDGFFETSNVFADGLLFANGILPWKDGAIVTAAPHILQLRDTDEDGKADCREVLFEGFSTQNPQLRVSHPILGLDGWVYVANGLRGGSVVSKKSRDAKPIALGGMDFRFNPQTFEAEAVSGMGQYGNAFDDYGNRFVCDNRNHLRHVVMPADALRRNPFLAVASPLEDVSGGEAGPLGSGARIFPISRNWTTSNLHAGHFTAACSVFVYRGDLLPFRGDAFTCDPTGNLVHREILTPHGATFRGRPAETGREFLATTDDWFRPVFLAHGPEGAMYVVDMQRAIIEHPEWMPPELRNHPNLSLGSDRGRIWRIVPAGYKNEPLRKDWSKADNRGLVNALDSTNVWQRTTAERLLLERQDKSAIEPLRDLLRRSKSDLARIHAAWLLEGLGGLDQPTQSSLSQGSPHVLEQALILNQRNFHDQSRSLPIRLAGHDDPRVRFQAALALTGEQEPTLDALAGIARRGDLDHWTRHAIASSAPNRAGDLLGRIPNAGPQMLRELALIVGARQNAGEIRRVVENLRGFVGDDRRLSVLLGLADGAARRGAVLGASGEDVDSIFALAATRAGDRRLPSDDRADAIRLLAHSPTGVRVLVELAVSNAEPDVRMKSIQALAVRSSAKELLPLVESWPSQGPAARKEIINALLSRADRTKALLDAVAAGVIAPREVDASAIARLGRHPVEGARARKLFASALPDDRKKVLERYRKSLTLNGDPARGREVFRKSCSTCHLIAGIGRITGPDISDTRTKTPEQLLIDIVDPSAAIDANYVAYTVSTKSGRTLSGLIASETASSVVLRRAEGQTDVVLRDDVEEIRSTGKSLMPDGLEASITVSQMADLIAFLKNWRYLK